MFIYLSKSIWCLCKMNIDCKNEMTFSKLLKYVIEHNKLLFALYIFVLVANPLRDVLLPHLIGKLYKTISAKKSIISIIIVIITIIIIIQILYIIADQVETYLHPSATHHIRELVIRHVFSINTTNYTDVEMGNFITKLLKLPPMTYNFMDIWKSTVFPNICTVLVSILYFAWKKPYLGVILTLVTLIVAYCCRRVFDVCTNPAKERDTHFNTLFTNIDDIMRNMLTVFNFNKEEDEIQRLLTFQNAYSKSTNETFKCSLVSKYVIYPLVIGFMIYLFVYCYQSIKKGKIDSSEFIALLIIGFIYMKSVFVITQTLKDLVFRWGIIQNSMQIFEECTVVREPYNKPPRSTDGIVFQDLDFDYVLKDHTKPVFKNLNLKINLNECTLIMGEIGSGKSTLISLLLKFKVPTKGEIFLNGVPYEKISHTELRDIIFYLPQIPYLLNRTIFENIVYGHENQVTREQVVDIFHKLGLDTFLKNLPHGLDTSVGIHGSRLSGGQKQIVWIVKAVLVNPQVIIMDEPTASVDASTKDIIHYLLKNIMKDRTVLMITHDPYLLQFANRVINFKDGTIVNDQTKKLK